MARIRGLEKSEVPPAIQEIYALQEEQYGTILNNTKVYAHCPGILLALRGLDQAIGDSGLIDPTLRALLNVRIAEINGCPL